MKISRNGAALGALAALMLAGAGMPAIGQDAQDSQDAPESLLPPGFGDPAPAPAPAPRPTRAPAAPAPAPIAAAPAPAPSPSPTDTRSEAEREAEREAREAARSAEILRYELPDYAKRSTIRVGAVAFGNAPLPADAFGAAGGRYLETLMRRLDAPVASRWLSIALRRTLMSRVDTPTRVDGADFAAERAWLLLRMGEANAARALVQDVDVANYTPKMFQVAMQTALATADPAALCPIAPQGSEIFEARGWNLARAMCAGLAGQAERAGEFLERAERGSGANDIDTLLAEKVIGTGTQGRRAVTIEWDGVGDLTAWRYGLAVATGVELPDRLFATAGPQVRYWYALAPGPDPAERAQSAELAATSGVFSNAGLVDLYSEIDAAGDASGTPASVARDLRRAYVAPEMDDRVSAMQSLWEAPRSERGRYARMILTARAAANVTPSAELLEASDGIVASMLSAGLARRTRGWSGFVERGRDAWAMLALADPAPTTRLSYNDADSYRANFDRRKAQLFFAGLAGLGRLSDGDAQRMAEALDVQIGAANRWTEAIDEAARARTPGLVVLLAAVGMQTREWADIPPETLFHIVAGLRAAGLETYARMIAVEAITRA